jgi:hypothetical protein
MKIIDIGTVLSNKDPQGIGRIRYFSFDDSISSKQKLYNGPEWDKKDPLVASPFLPTHLSIIPEEKQSVKIIKHIAESDGIVNQEYIPGPFTTSHDFKNQVFKTQLTFTSYGIDSMPGPNVKDFSNSKITFEDNYVEANSVGTMAKTGDIAVYGNYGSDLLLTENGAQLRAGKFVTKETKSKSIKDKLSNYPYRGKTISKLSLKKFPFTAELVKERSIINGINRSDLAHIVEYDINDFANPTGVTLNIYKVKGPEGEKFKTDKFDSRTYNISGNTEQIYSDTIEISSIEEAYVTVRNFISTLDNDKMSVTSTTLPETYAHPFYFRPVIEPNSLVERAVITTLEIENKNKFLTNIKVSIRDNHGLFFDKDSAEPTEFQRIKEVNVVRNKHITLDRNNKIIREDFIEQSIGSVISDKFYILSSEKNGLGDRRVDFPNLTKYELNQTDYLEKIDPSTFALVRGEKLIEILELIVDMLLGHKHGVVTPPKWPKELKEKINDLKNRMKEDMVNSSLRIN